MNGAIGKQGTLPWHLPNDLRWFKKNTVNQFVVMGRTTFEGLPIQPLPRRVNVVMTKQDSYKAPGVVVCNSIHEVLSMAQSLNCQEIIIMGGGEIYKLFYPLASQLYITYVHTKIAEADTHFVSYDLADWYLDFEEIHERDDNHDYRYDFRIYKRKLIAE